MENSKRLYRSNTDKVIGGVSGGLANYLSVDPVLIRVAFVLLTLFGGGGILIYIVMWIAIPAEVIDYKAAFNKDQDIKTTPVEKATPVKTDQSNTALIAGVILIILGMLFLADRLIPFYNLHDFWPVILIFVGILVIKPDLFKGKPAENNDNHVVVETVEQENPTAKKTQENKDNNSNNQETKNL